MAITLGSNIASLQAQRQLFKTEQNLSSVFERLSSGQRINRASDDAAGLAISESLNTDRRVFNQGIRNLNDGLSVLNIADSTVAELSGIVIRIQELAEQAANGSLSSTQRKSLDAEAQELKDEFFRVSRSADFNGLRLFDGSIEDGLRLQAGYGTDGSIFSSLGGAMGDGTFQGVQTFGAGDGANSVALGDLNGDGNPDLVTANPNGNDVTVLIGNGNGTFQSVETFTAGDGASSVRLSDLNGDGVLDLATANSNGSDTTILLGNGDGSFKAAQTFNLGADSSLEVEDLNGDGVVDLITAGGPGVNILLGNGDGTFLAAETFGTSASGNSVTVGDINGDGLLDLVTLNGGGADASAFLGNGDGTFQAAQTISTGNSLGSGLLALGLGDVDGDGILDLVATDVLYANVRVLTGNGDGTFTETGTFQNAAGAPLAIEFGDLNGDGALDIITANSVAYSGTSVLLGNGDGTFGAVEIFDSGYGTASVALGDLNGDGVFDLAVANASGDSAVLLGNTREGIAPILDFSLLTQADALQALAPLERKLNSLSEQRGTIGAFQSRLQSALNTLNATSENYAAAESRIKDADIAFESSQLTRLNILQQAAAAVLGQANLQPSLALQLLR